MTEKCDACGQTLPPPVDLKRIVEANTIDAPRFDRSGKPLFRKDGSQQTTSRKLRVTDVISHQAYEDHVTVVTTWGEKLELPPK